MAEEPQNQDTEEEPDWLPEASKKIVRSRVPDYQARSGAPAHECEACQ